MSEQATTIDAQLLDLMLRAGSQWVLWLLLGLSLVALAVAGERIWFFNQERRPGARLAAALAALKRSGPAAALDKLKDARSMEAAVARVALEHVADGPAAMEEHVEATLEHERLRYERGLAFLGTLGNNAPFVGLFGTVLGIIRAFHDLATSGVSGSQAVMAGIGEALVATGIGLLVALPAVAAYNAFIRHVETRTAQAGALGHELLAFVKSTRNPAAADPAGGEAG